MLSQFWPDAMPSKTNFPMRNATMSGYAAATVIVEAPWRSGARRQARIALRHGRPVFLPRPLLEYRWAREYAEQPGTSVVAGPDELLERLGEVLFPARELTWASSHNGYDDLSSADDSHVALGAASVAYRRDSTRQPRSSYPV